MSVEERLEKLEQQNRWMKRIGAVAGALVAAVVLMGQGKDAGRDEIETKTLIARKVVAEEFVLQGGAKNHVVVLPDADLDTTTQIVADSAFGCAGQRCLAVSAAITVGEAQKTFRDAIVDAAGSIQVGYGLDEGTAMGPVITPQSKARIEGCIAQGTGEGAVAVLDGRQAQVSGYDQGNFLKPTVLDGVSPESGLSNTEIFGPVLSLIHADSVEEAIEIIARNPYGNASSIFTSSGAAARKFRYEVPTGNVGVNIGVAAPMAYFPFSGWKDSFLGVLHGQGRDAIEFYTDKKVVIERWPKDWSRKF